MECKKYHKLISREIDNEISEYERESLKLHLSQCLKCRQFKFSLLSVSDIHAGIKDVEPPSTILSGIMSGIHEKNDDWALAGWAKFAVSVAAVFVMLVGAGVGNFLAEKSAVDVNPVEDNIFHVEYLGNYPPGSVGYLVAAAMEGDKNEGK
ncbi:zf-HC2 domain-containing protein [bacterium]|nr:zf-HC2 domain-containing protein [bacterium]